MIRREILKKAVHLALTPLRMSVKKPCDTYVANLTKLAS